jgi:hypothetical protein
MISPRIAKVEIPKGFGMCSMYSWQDGCHLSSTSDIRYDRDAMRVVPCGLGWSSSCVLGEWEMVCPCDRGQLFLLCLGLLFADKEETFGFVRDLILRLKNERHGDVVRVIRSDNGSEFKNSRFKTFCHDLGLEHQFSSPYVACQNCVVERKNCSFREMARTMLDEDRTLRRY